MITEKYCLLDEINKALDRCGYKRLDFQGCFDILAKNDMLLAIKALTNIDAMPKDNATSLKVFSKFLLAKALIVSLKNNRGKLAKNVIYSRYGIPVLNPDMFREFAENEWLPSIFAIKGGHTADIDTDHLKVVRKEMKMSLDGLAKKIGVSKKCLYEIENKYVKPSKETLEKIEDFFGLDLVKPCGLKEVDTDDRIMPRNMIERRISEKFDEIDVEHSCLSSLPIDIIAKKQNLILTGIFEGDKNLERRAGFFNIMEDFINAWGVFVVSKTEMKSSMGVPIISGDELPSISKFRDFSRIVRDRRGL